MVDSTAGGRERVARTVPSGAVWLVPLLTAALTLAVYVATLTPEVDWSDAAELALQAHQLGVTHPPGYPVHTLLGKLLSLAVDEPAVATNLLSALGASLCAGLISLVALRQTGDWRAGPLAGLFFAFVPPVWSLAFITVWNRWQPRFWTKGKGVAVPWRTKDKTLYRYYYLFSYLELEKLAKQAGFQVLKSFPESSYRYPLKFLSRNICLLIKKGS